MTVRVVLVDDHALFRAGVRSELLAFAGRVEIVGEAADVDGAVTVVRARSPGSPRRRTRPPRPAAADSSATSASRSAASTPTRSVSLLSAATSRASSSSARRRR